MYIYIYSTYTHTVERHAGITYSRHVCKLHAFTYEVDIHKDYTPTNFLFILMFVLFILDICLVIEIFHKF